MEAGDLPQEILIDIFSRLPLKSVGKCRCLAKLWRQQLSSPRFIKSHLTRKTHQEYLILSTPFNTIYSISNIKDDTIWKKLPGPGPGRGPGRWTEVVGSCHGLVLLVMVNADYEKFLVNPITLQQVKVPNWPLALNWWESVSMHGFGYDSSSDDYKVVTLSYCQRVTLVDVKSICPGAFVNEAIHWLVPGREPGSPSVIAAFNLANEVFVEIPAPTGVDMLNIMLNKLVVRGGCLCLLYTREHGQTDVWTMEEYGLKESWTKFTIHDDIRRPLGWLGDEEVVLLSKLEALLVYNRTNGTLRNMGVDGHIPVLDGCTFMESLVSPASIGPRSKT
ncbi:UNVERIFIED_CONTAM: F-box/kelch-repeat protein [Sesamum radiatum]|uniref:F-box/kelch-repeat protein n=1 Tax=Sesamum radiatum TaxID=300843 RepID=A0AAW2UBN9_SESRA